MPSFVPPLSLLLVTSLRPAVASLATSSRWPTMQGLHFLALVASLGSLLSQSSILGAAAQGETPVHEQGRCAIRGHCGKQSIFGGELPCPDNGLAEDPEPSVRKKLVDLCGAKWEQGPLCCLEEQVRCSYYYAAQVDFFFFFSLSNSSRWIIIG